MLAGIHPENAVHCIEEGEEVGESVDEYAHVIDGTGETRASNDVNGRVDGCSVGRS